MKWRNLLDAYAVMENFSVKEFEDASYNIVKLVPQHEISEFYRMDNSAGLSYEKRYALNESARDACLIPDVTEIANLFKFLLSLDNRLQIIKVVTIWIDGASETKAVIEELVNNLPEDHNCKALLQARLNPIRYDLKQMDRTI